MRKQICLLSILLTAGMAAALGTKNKDRYVIDNTTPLISHTLIEEADLEFRWQMNLPVKKKESIQTLSVLGPYLYVLTDTNAMFCIERTKGKLLFTEQLGTRDLPVCQPLYYEKDFWFVVGSEMLVFDSSAGYITNRKSLKQIGNIATYGFARNTKNLYLAGSDRRVHVINTDGYWQQFTATADNDSEIISVVATDDVVVFATYAGNVVAMNPNKAEKIWQFDLTGEIVTPLVLDKQSVYVAGMDSKLYQLNIKSGTLVWTSPFHSGSPVHEPFTVGKDVVYLKNSLNGLYGVSKKTGKDLWRVPMGKGMICETASRSYVYAAPGIMKCLENNTGKELYALNFSDVQKYASNTNDPYMYLTDLKGRLMCISAVSAK